MLGSPCRREVDSPTGVLRMLHLGFVPRGTKRLILGLCHHVSINMDYTFFFFCISGVNSSC
eukprot:CCRYP_014653-RA/>CCRYP_014653-RA protein AED:0.25 eAED:0.25 QI:89/1/0.5/1/0/0/2/0/60